MADQCRVLIIGAGLGGVCAGIQLLQAGITDFRILERENEPGGTWRDNTYPGCACDVAIALYQFSFAPSAHWRHIFPRAAEVKQYVDQLVAGFGLAPHFRWGQEAVSTVWDDDRCRWHTTTRSGAEFDSGSLVVALGQLNRPSLPDIPGRDTFAGPAFHSARWDHSVSLEGRRAGVIGCAASGVQLIPEVAKTASHVTVFQRTPNWLLPRMDREISPEEMALMVTAPEVGALTRELLFQNSEQVLWQAFSWTPEGRTGLTRMSTMHLEAQVPDPGLRRKLMPSYPIGCKRILFSDDYYPTLQQANVTLDTGAIDSIVPGGVRMRDGVEHPLDILVYATGFETTGWRWSLELTGRGGGILSEAWKRGPEAYLGITVAGFPNFFMLYGPNTNLGHNSITYMIERQTEFIVQALTAMEQRGLAAIEPSQEAQDRFNRKLQADLAHTTWADPSVASWYKNAEGRITQNWSSHCRDYAAAVKNINFADFVTRTRSSAQAAG